MAQALVPNKPCSRVGPAAYQVISRSWRRVARFLNEQMLAR